MASLDLVGRPVAHWHSDASVVGGTEAGTAKRLRLASGANGDLWEPLFASMLKSSLPVATKVAAHQTLKQVVKGDIAFEHYLGNGLADVAAALAAELYQEEGPVHEQMEKNLGLAFLLCERLSAIEAACWQAAPKLFQLPVRAPLELPAAPVLSAEVQRSFRDSGHQLFRTGPWTEVLPMPQVQVLKAGGGLAKAHVCC